MTDKEIITNEDFMKQCNEAGAEKTRKTLTFDDTAKLCGHVKGFTPKGLSFLASLLSDYSTAAGKQKEGGAPIDPSKRWSAQFLAKFNATGDMELNNHVFLKHFAQQISEGNDEFDPSKYEVVPKDSSLAKLPRREIIETIIKQLHQDDEELTLELICEEIEDYYDENDMLLPDKWEDITQRNIRTWFSNQYKLIP